MTYVTVDLDWPEVVKIVGSWYWLENNTNGTVHGRVSSSGHGVHLRSHYIKDYPVPVNEKQRRCAGDDPVRIEGDIQNEMEESQVMYDSKGDKEAGEWTESLSELIANYRQKTVKTPEQHHFTKRHL